MVPLRLGRLSDPVGEVERLAEIFERVFFFQVMLADDLPAAAELFQQAGDLCALERRHAAPARNALLRSQFAHTSPLKFLSDHPKYIAANETTSVRASAAMSAHRRMLPAFLRNAAASPRSSICSSPASRLRAPRAASATQVFSRP